MNASSMKMYIIFPIQGENESEPEGTGKPSDAPFVEHLSTEKWCSEHISAACVHCMKPEFKGLRFGKLERL